MGVNSLPKTVTRQRRGCDLKTGYTEPEYSTLTTRLPSEGIIIKRLIIVNEIHLKFQTRGYEPVRRT